MSGATLIEARGIRPATTGLEHMPRLDISLQENSVVCLVGPDSRLLRGALYALSAILPAGEGELRWQGEPVNVEDPHAWAALRTKIGAMTSDTPLLSVHHGLFNTMLPALYHSDWSFQRAASEARKRLRETGADFELTLLPAYLSGLQRAQVGLARAIILDAPMLVLEDPMRDLDPDEEAEFVHFLLEVKKNRRLCIMMATGDWRFVRRHADRIIFLSPENVQDYSGWDDMLSAGSDEVRRFLHDEGVDGSSGQAD